MSENAENAGKRGLHILLLGGAGVDDRPPSVLRASSVPVPVPSSSSSSESVSVSVSVSAAAAACSPNFEYTMSHKAVIVGES